MKPLDLDSERYSAYGNVTARGILNQLGRPNLDILSVLVRETVQNSWDARLSGSESLRYGIDGRTLSGEQLNMLRDVVFVSEPENLGLRKILSSGADVPVLIIYDRGTVGLSGPTRADSPDDGTRLRNFINFFRNVGQPPDRYLGGGTYGYGKAILYLASQIHTICVHTHCLSQGMLEHRFIAAALESPPENEEQRQARGPYTGRHWWGRFEKGIIEPLSGSEACDLAQRLGMPAFSREESGTSWMILLPSLGEISLEDVMHLIVTILLWNFWPKMLRQENKLPAINFEVSWEGNPIPLPDPRNYPPLHGFAQAMEYLKNRFSSNEDNFLRKVVSIDCQRPKQHLGLLSLQKFQFESRRDQLSTKEDISVPITGLCHHVALMRKAELVVKYLAGPPLPSGRIEYAGVFIVDESVDRIFAEAEPPTHDDWLPHFLKERYEKTFIRVALDRLRQALADFTAPQPTISKEGIIYPLGAFADQLGGLLLGEEGPGGYVQLLSGEGARPSGGSEQSRNNGKENKDVKSTKNDTSSTTIEGSNLAPESGHSQNTRHARVKLLGESRLDLVDSTPVLLMNFSVEHAPGSPATRVEVEAGAVLDNGELEREPPANSSPPEVLLWIDPNGRKLSGSSVLVVPASETGTWGVAVSIPDDMVIGMILGAKEI